MPDTQPGSAATERAAIVAWLRASVREADAVLTDMAPGAPGRIAMQIAASWYATAADLIEEGAHHAD